MEQKTVEYITTVILRFVGLMTLFVGLILTTQTIIQLIAAQSASSLPRGLPPGVSVNVSGALGRMGAWAIVGNAAIIVWGGLLFGSAKALASGIAQEGAPPQQDMPTD